MLEFADDPCRYSRPPRRPYPVGSTRGAPSTITPRWQISPASRTAYRSSRSVRPRSRCRPSSVRGVLERSGRLMIHHATPGPFPLRASYRYGGPLYRLGPARRDIVPVSRAAARGAARAANVKRSDGGGAEGGGGLDLVGRARAEPDRGGAGQ